MSFGVVRGYEPLSPKRHGLDVYDALGLAGVLSLETGVYLLSLEAALILLGCLLVAVAIWPDVRKGAR
jgi:hypothetical protein